MGIFHEKRISCYCAFCKSPRRVYVKKRINLFNIAGAGLGSAAIMLAIWQEFDPRVLFVFVVLLAIAEIFVQIRWRLNMVCQHCGFDPVLYLKDHERAAQKVKLHLEQRRNDPISIFRSPLHLPKISQKRLEELTSAAKVSEKGPSKGRLVSRQI